MVSLGFVFVFLLDLHSIFLAIFLFHRLLLSFISWRGVGNGDGAAQPLVLFDGLRTSDGALGGLRGVRVMLGPLGREHVWCSVDGRVLAAVRLAGA